MIFVEEQDEVVNPLGAKGLGEIGVVGVAAAIANAVFHATGKRVRDLPITLDKLMRNIGQVLDTFARVRRYSLNGRVAHERDRVPSPARSRRQSALGVHHRGCERGNVCSCAGTQCVEVKRTGAVASRRSAAAEARPVETTVGYQIPPGYVSGCCSEC